MEIDLYSNLYISLGIIVALVLAVKYFPEFERALKSPNSSSNAQNNIGRYGILPEVFHRYNHRNAMEWSKWIRKEHPQEQALAIKLLVNHLDSDPSTWGGITPEAILSLAKFKQSEFFKYFQGLIVKCKKFWKKYQICQSCYEDGLRSLILIDEKRAIRVFADEIDKTNTRNQANAIVKAAQLFSANADLAPLVVSILCNPEFSYFSKTEILNFVLAKEPDLAHKIMLETSHNFLRTMSPLDSEELRLMEDLIQNLLGDKPDKQSFCILLKACKHIHISATAIRIAEKRIKTNRKFFNQEQKFNLMSTRYDKNNIIEATLIDQNELNSDEKRIVKAKNFEEKFKFNRGTIVEESLEHTLAIPMILKDIFTRFKQSSREAGMIEECAGGLLVVGESGFEKLLFARALAAERRWKFLYTPVEEITKDSGATLITSLTERLASAKPCLLFLDGIEKIITKSGGNLSEHFIDTLNDPMINIVGAINHEIEINEHGHYRLEKENSIIDAIFSKAFIINKPNQTEKSAILTSKLSKLNEARGKEHYDQFRILDPAEEMNLLEFENYLSRYFKVSLLTAGKLIPSSEFLELEASEGKYKE